MSKQPAEVQPIIYEIRGQRFVQDSVLAKLYGVSTKRFNEAFKRSRNRFPEDFAFQISREEFDALRSQIATSNKGRGGRRYLPWVFTEHGALMAANILRSDRATEMSVYVVRAFVRLRELSLTNATILKRLAEIDRTLLVHDKALQELYRKLLPLLTPEPLPEKRRIGFKLPED